MRASSTCFTVSLGITLYTEYPLNSIDYNLSFTFTNPQIRLINIKLGLSAGYRMRQRITAKLVDELQPKDKIYDVTDDLLPGFVIRVNPSSLKVFWLRYKLLSGKRDRIALGRASILSVAQARHEAKKILGQIATGMDPKGVRISSDNQIPTLLEFVDSVYKPWSEAHHQWHRIHLMRLYRLPFLKIPLNEIKVFEVEKWRSERLKAGLSPNTVNRDYTALRAILTKAVEWGVLTDHPLQKVKLLKVDRSPNVRYLTEDEEMRLRSALDLRESKIKEERESANQWRTVRQYELLPDLHALPFVDHVKPLVLLSLNTGVRQGELFRLRWEDVDFDRRNIAIVMRGKRKSNTRHIPLNKEAHETLLAWRNMHPQGDKLVFPSADGKRFDNIQGAWDNIKKNAKLDNFRWHDMRHHFASRLVMNGVPLNTVRELLGHTNVEMTLRYAHLAPEQKERAVATLDRVV